MGCDPRTRSLVPNITPSSNPTPHPFALHGIWHGHAPSLWSVSSLIATNPGGLTVTNLGAESLHKQPSLTRFEFFEFSRSALTYFADRLSMSLASAVGIDCSAALSCRTSILETHRSRTHLSTFWSLYPTHGAPPDFNFGHTRRKPQHKRLKSRLLHLMNTFSNRHFEFSDDNNFLALPLPSLVLVQTLRFHTDSPFGPSPRVSQQSLCFRSCPQTFASGFSSIQLLHTPRLGLSRGTRQRPIFCVCSASTCPRLATQAARSTAANRVAEKMTWKIPSRLADRVALNLAPRAPTRPLCISRDVDPEADSSSRRVCTVRPRVILTHYPQSSLARHHNIYRELCFAQHSAIVYRASLGALSVLLNDHDLKSILTAPHLIPVQVERRVQKLTGLRKDDPQLRLGRPGSFMDSNIMSFPAHRCVFLPLTKSAVAPPFGLWSFISYEIPPEFAPSLAQHCPVIYALDPEICSPPDFDVVEGKPNSAAVKSKPKPYIVTSHRKKNSTAICRTTAPNDPSVFVAQKLQALNTQRPYRDPPTGKKPKVLLP
ncbi:hypothetical protein IWZ03DRAFT_363610 [Phyllosticta citriasiana]|uniref:Uncharacterized protein n=1 Tax=Phyllosticta citriasiana TaxID=595635 RepID=A0ABR1K9L5_9PEZI